MSTRSMTASSLSAPFVLAIVVLLAMLFAMMQSAGIQPFGQAQASHPAAAPLYRGVVQLFKSESAPADENQTAVAQRLSRWQPYIAEASMRYALPATWIRAIINIESSGRTAKDGHAITSGAGAVGVMQLMRGTYKAISQRDGLGSDPQNAHDNILAGSAYLRDLYNKFGYPGLFAAYNAGPSALIHHKKLPVETQNYVKMAMAGASNAELTWTDLHALVNRNA
ncbi:MAG TPA: lytic transglycosylase domain-containing protein [Micropepsaceae bacterium]|nr:lytic transglycosylase domain-containing protein [Micropepsaceae bacterium]